MDSEREAARRIAAAIGAVMSRRGLSKREHTNKLAEVLELSPVAARRRMRGAAAWPVGDVFTVMKAFGEPVSTALSLMREVAVDVYGLGREGACVVPATLTTGPQELQCSLWTGGRVPHGVPYADGALIAVHDDGTWRVMPAATSLGQPGIRYEVVNLEIVPAKHAPLRIAILDDHREEADDLRDCFKELGYQAESYYSDDRLIEALKCSPRMPYDAYVVDWKLGARRTAFAVCEQVRAHQPDVALVLLTGRLRDSAANEADLAAALRSLGVTFFEKPVSLAVLSASLERHFAERARPVPTR